MMRAIVLHQPWAGCAALDVDGRKDVENRGRDTRVRGIIAIVAGQHPLPAVLDHRVRQLLATWGGRLQHLLERRGEVIAVAVLDSSHPANQAMMPVSCCYPWGDRDYGDRPAWHWMLRDPFPLPEPVACKGAQGWWFLPPEVETAVRLQVSTEWWDAHSGTVVRG
jgi:hypothetical protein